MKPIRVMIVEDSPVVQEHLRRIISSDARLAVAGIAGSGEVFIEGAAGVSFENVNTFTGPVIITAGILTAPALTDAGARAGALWRAGARRSSGTTGRWGGR